MRGTVGCTSTYFAIRKMLFINVILNFASCLKILITNYETNTNTLFTNIELVWKSFVIFFRISIKFEKPSPCLLRDVKSWNLSPYYDIKCVFPNNAGSG